MSIPKTFEEYLAVDPEYTAKQVHLCLRKMGVRYIWHEDATQHCLMKLWERKTIERFDLSKRNKGTATDSRTTDRLFWSYVNLCIWRFLTHWNYVYAGGFIRRGKDIKNSAGLISHNKDALDRAVPLPDNFPNAHNPESFTWEESPAAQDEAKGRYDFALQNDEWRANWHDDLMRFREWLQTSYKPKRRNPRVPIEHLILTFDCMLRGCSGREMAAKLGLKAHQSATNRVSRVLVLMRKFFKEKSQ